MSLPEFDIIPQNEIPPSLVLLDHSVVATWLQNGYVEFPAHDQCDGFFGTDWYPHGLNSEKIQSIYRSKSWFSYFSDILDTYTLAKSIEEFKVEGDASPELIAGSLLMHFLHLHNPDVVNLEWMSAMLVSSARRWHVCREDNNDESSFTMLGRIFGSYGTLLEHAPEFLVCEPSRANMTSVINKVYASICDEVSNAHELADLINGFKRASLEKRMQYESERLNQEEENGVVEGLLKSYRNLVLLNLQLREQAIHQLEQAQQSSDKALQKPDRDGRYGFLRSLVFHNSHLMHPLIYLY